MTDKYFRKVAHRGYADWVWEVGVGYHWMKTPNRTFGKGSESSRAKAVEAAAEAIKAHRAADSCRWVEVPA
jgi:hypothetical protein